MGKIHKIRDPVHNFVELREQDLKIIDTPVFQRLRGIRQLAMANLAYPGALHTRFDHSLGVCHVAGMMAESLGLDGEEVTLVRLAALLHDLGHGPFSHVSEKSLARFADKANMPQGQKTEKIHELITAELIEKNERIVAILGVQTCGRIAKLLAKGHGHPAMKAIVSGPLDADKQDYLLRDSRFCGVTYGVYDIHQLHRALKLGGATDDRELWITAKGTTAVEQFVLAKYYMTTNVYRHRVRLITDQMLTRAISLGIDYDKLPVLESLYRYDGSDGFVKHYIQWDDARFLREFQKPDYADTACGQIVRRLAERRLFKRVFHENVAQFSAAARDAIVTLADSPDIKGKLESAITAAIKETDGLEVDRRFVIVNPVSVKLDRSIAVNDDASIMVDTPGGATKFEDRSALIVALERGFSEKYLEVYAPVDWDSATEKKRLLSRLHSTIKESVEAFFASLSSLADHQ